MRDNDKHLHQRREFLRASAGLRAIEAALLGGAIAPFEPSQAQTASLGGPNYRPNYSSTRRNGPSSTLPLSIG